MEDEKIIKYDMFKNKLEEGQNVIYESDKFITKTGVILYIADNSILVQADGFKLQIFNKDSNVLPVVVIGTMIK